MGLLAKTPETVSAYVSLETEIPEVLYQGMKQFIGGHPHWDQYRVMSSALAHFLFQNGCEDRAVVERYLDDLFTRPESRLCCRRAGRWPSSSGLGSARPRSASRRHPPPTFRHLQSRLSGPRRCRSTPPHRLHRPRGCNTPEEPPVLTGRQRPEKRLEWQVEQLLISSACPSAASMHSAIAVYVRHHRLFRLAQRQSI